MRNVELLSTTKIVFGSGQPHRCGFLIDNLGFSNVLGTPNGTRGVWYSIYSHYSIERSTTNPYGAETYCALVTALNTPLGNGEDRYGDIRISVPIQSGDNITVTTHGRRNGFSNDCASLILDPQQAWFTTQTHSPTLTTDATYYEFTVTGTTAAGTANKGTVDILLRELEYDATGTFQWGGLTIDVTRGGVVTRYLVSMQQGFRGQPVIDSADHALVADVESGVVYNDGNLTGTLVAGGAAPGPFEIGAWR